MRLIIFFFIAFILSSGVSFGQLPSSVEKLEGTWRYKGGSGYEHWKKEDGKLIGHTFRITRLGDTTKTEDIVLNKINNRLVYSLTTFNVIKDSLVTSHHGFIGGKRKMEFLNLSEIAPYSIEYKFGFLNRNKLKVLVKNTMTDAPSKYILYRIKE